MNTSTDSRAVFRRLHESGCFVMPNPWDVGSARVLEQLGFPALATTSSGLAWSLGKRDNSVSRNERLAIDPDAFGEIADFKREVDRLVRDIRGSERMPGVDRIWMPGEQSHEKRVRQAREGITLAPQLVKIP